MRNNFRLAAAGLVVALCMPFAFSDETNGDQTTCGQYGTTVQFEKTPSDAAKRALKEEKLVCVLHVSGDFENPDFT
ncbi:MAG: hypothetical protein HY040_14540 [Planctomycetes bacterium]|nr:hypothetical protein [Planctomycetota bacterium]